MCLLGVACCACCVACSACKCCKRMCKCCVCAGKCCIKALKISLFIFQFIFWIAGCAMLGIGIYLAVADPTGDYQGMLEGLSSDFWDVAVAFMIVLGIVIFTIGFLGCCGTMKESSCMLCWYSVLMSVVLAIQISIAVFVALQADEIDKYLSDNMEDQIKYDYQGPESDDALSQSWDNLQEDLECCAANSYIDYQGSNYSVTSGYPVPSTCCIKSDDADDVLRCYEEAQYYNGTTFNYLNDKGCYKTVTDFVDEYAIIIYAVIFSIAFLELLSIIVGCVMCCSVDDDDDVSKTV